jgi:pimeloyl-ACP methyl ester carboxylesterase
MRYVYLHGFASSPDSRKAQAFAKAFEAREIVLEIPALDSGDFEHLTISGQLSIVEKLLQGEAACLIGSSMGGYLAALYASRHAETARLVLLAPAFNFPGRWAARADHDGQWSASGWLEVYHYGDKRQRRLHYGMIEDARQYPPTPDFHQPCLILHGTNDDTVPVTESREFAGCHPAALLRELDSDHELANVLETVIVTGMTFLGL